MPFVCSVSEACSLLAQNMRTVLIVAAAIAFCALISVARAQDDLADYPIKVRCARTPGIRDCGQLTRAAGGAMRELRGVSHGMREEGTDAASLCICHDRSAIHKFRANLWAQPSCSCPPTGSSLKSWTAPTPAPLPTARRSRPRSQPKPVRFCIRLTTHNAGDCRRRHACFPRRAA